jgi:hypothetical protein
VVDEAEGGAPESARRRRRARGAARDPALLVQARQALRLHAAPARDRPAHDRAVGDCDDFAAWRAAWLLSGDPIVGHYPNDRPDVYIAILKFKRAAHAVTIWNDEHGNWLWADYGAPFTAPYSVAPPVFAIGRRVAVAHNRTPLIGVAYARVTLRDNGALRFGRVKVGAV